MRELTNVIEALMDEAQDNQLSDSEIFFFTDNSAVESALYQGSSSSKKMLDVVRLHALQIRQGLKITVFNVSGKRLIDQAADGISRGLFTEEVMGGPLAMHVRNSSPCICQLSIGPHV